MRFSHHYLRVLVLLCFSQLAFGGTYSFIRTQNDLLPFYQNENILMVASVCRSGSTMLKNVLNRDAIQYRTLKTHILPPNSGFIGKIIFLFSNPDKAAESALHLVIQNSNAGDKFFHHMESSDKNWLKNIGSTTNQSLDNNLLSFDALGYNVQLSEWLHCRTEPCDISDSQILAIKFENLWDDETIEMMKLFLGVTSISLPPKRERGYDLSKLHPNEILFRNYYNIGSKGDPKYRAYDDARILWESAPPFQFLKLNKQP